MSLKSCLSWVCQQGPSKAATSFPLRRRRSKLKAEKVCPRQSVSFRARTTTPTTTQVKESVLRSVSQDVHLVVPSPLTLPIELSQLWSRGTFMGPRQERSVFGHKPIKLSLTSGIQRQHSQFNKNINYFNHKNSFGAVTETRQKDEGFVVYIHIE